ncbi:MAG: protein kinase [Kiritimatiellae bacterium]|nr:protein kinase [Kiritimatiellia bacterium]
MTPPPDLAALFPEASFAAKTGAGACGEVWLARFPDGAWRSVKFVAGDSAAADRELRAIRLLLSLGDPRTPAGTPLHPALMPVADLRESPAGFAYAMPPADSLRPGWTADPAQYRPRTLAADLLARRALPLPECLDLAEALAGALGFLQRHCLVHRDLKPSNVLYLAGRPVLADFGLLADTREAGSVVGTPGYVPGEQHGRFPADLFSLGVLLSEAATGRPAAEAGFAPVEEADVSHPLYPRFLDLLRRATDDNPARRPQTAAAFLAALRGLRETPPRCRRRLWTLLALLLLLPVALLFFRSRPRISSAPPDAPATPAPSDPDPDVPQPDVPVVPAVPAPAPPSPATNRPLLYVSRDMADAGAFLQLYTDRIRVGLPLRGFTAEDAALLLVLPPDDPAFAETDDWTGPAPWRLVPLVPATPENTPPDAADAPVFPADAPSPARTTHAAIAFLPPDAPYPEAVFFLPAPPHAWEPRLAALPDATFGDLEYLWMRACEPF